VPELAVVGSLSIDRVDGGPPRPGGCPSFAGDALRRLEGHGIVVTRCAASNRPFFAAALDRLGVPVAVVDAETTAAFTMTYEDDHRTMSVDAIGDAWQPQDVVAVGWSGWVHVAPLLRSDFPAETLAALTAAGARISYDGQGLVRAPRVGPLALDDRFDRALLATIQTLKLAEEEAAIVSPDGRDARSIARLGVPEVVVTLGSAGSIVICDGAERHIPTIPVDGVEATGAGDVFMVGYGAARTAGADPVDAAQSATELVHRTLSERRAAR
jgi:sugar/nucleoside kinase (ribokinase family)